MNRPPLLRRRQRGNVVPPLSRLYFAIAFVSLPLALGVIGVAPRAAGGFFYHARLLGIVHLVTLGWITSVILGCLYIVVPSRLGGTWRIRAGDYCAFASTVIGLIGMIAHFWIEEYGGMAWSGLMVLAGVGYVVGRAWPRVLRAAHPARLPLLLGMANIVGAGTAGVVLGFDKVHHFLPGYVISNVLGHAHLAALGWACMMSLGLASALRPEANRQVTRWSIVMLEAASLGLFLSLLAGSSATIVFSVVAVATLVGCAVRICPNGPGAPGRHAKAAIGYLGLAGVSGIALATLGSSEFMMRVALVYGAAGLLGFLAQWLLVIVARLEPGLEVTTLTFGVWSAGVATLTAGLFLDSESALAFGAWLGLVGTLLPVVPAVAACLARPLSWTHASRSRRRPANQFTVSPGRS